MNSNKFVKTVLVGTGTMLVLIGGMTAVIDPFFHYHKPLAQLEYPLERGRERYLNNGIIRNFDYDSAITGTSMMQNFKTSQFDKLFDAHSVKVTLTGDTYWAIDEEIRMIFQNKSDIKYIFRCLDYNKVFNWKVCKKGPRTLRFLKPRILLINVNACEIESARKKIQVIFTNRKVAAH